MKALAWTRGVIVGVLLLGCTKESASDSGEEDTGFTCGTADEVCERITEDAEGFGVELPTTRTSAWTGWRPTCYASADEARAADVLGEDWQVTESPGLWFDFTLGEPDTFRYLDCAFVEWTSFPYALENEEGDEIDGLPVAWLFAPGTEAWKVEELVLGVETSWEWRFGTECCADGYDDHLYDWTSWAEGTVQHWRFCHVSESDAQAVQECHEFAYDPAAEALGALVTTSAESLSCFGG